MKFRKKPVVVEALKWDGENTDEVSWFLHCDPVPRQAPILIETLEGEMTAQVGDWIIKGVKGEFYPCKPDIFEATYEKEDDS